MISSNVIYICAIYAQSGTSHLILFLKYTSHCTLLKNIYKCHACVFQVSVILIFGILRKNFFVCKVVSLSELTNYLITFVLGF